MRASEFITEAKVIDYEGAKLLVSIDGATIDIRTLDPEGKQAAYVVFDRDGKNLIPDDLAVDEEYRGQGIAKKMYDYVKSLGFTIRASDDQTTAGSKFWKKNRGEERVWETQILDEVPLPPDWDPEQLNLRQTFKNRLKYALDRAKRLGGGSSRVAMTIEYEGRPTALKVAKNLKGLAQNEAEIEILDDGYLGNLPIIIPLIDYDKANARPVWLQTEIAKKVTKPTLIKLLHSPNMYLFVSKVKSILGQPGALVDKQIKTIYFRSEKDWNPTEKDWEIFNEYASEVADLVGQSKLDVGDLPNPANWGIFNNRPVIIDLGFTSDTKSLYGFKG